MSMFQIPYCHQLANHFSKLTINHCIWKSMVSLTFMWNTHIWEVKKFYRQRSRVLPSLYEKLHECPWCKGTFKQWENNKHLFGNCTIKYVPYFLPYLISLTKRLRIIILRSKGKMFFQWNNRVDSIKHI